MFVKLGDLVIETEDIRAMQEFTARPAWYKPWSKARTCRQVMTNTVGTFALEADEYEALLCIMRPRVVEIVTEPVED